MKSSYLAMPLIFCTVCASAVAALAQSGDQSFHAPARHWTEPCNVVWTSPSHDAAGSMLLGNGQVGMNLWVEEDGDLRFYISRTDSLTEASRLVKVGGVRISLDPNPFKAGKPFRQELHLADGLCEITAGEARDKVTLRIFVDAEQPVIHVIGESATPLRIKAAADVWRTAPHVLAGEELNSSWTLHGSPTPVVESADVFLAQVTPNGTVAWYHRNETSPAFAATLRVQSLESVAEKVHDPLLHRTFGGWMTATAGAAAGESDFKSIAGHAIESPGAVTTFEIRVGSPCGQTDTVQTWLDEAGKLSRATAAASAQARTAAAWRDFWDRSWVIVHGDQTGVRSVTRGYTLQRYMMACGGRGPLPIKFNGSIFTVEPKAMGKPYNADWRAWGDCHWWQNVRFSYHAMLAGGDFDMMDPLFAMYERARPLAEARSRLYHGAEGCYFPETMTVWGTYSNGDYGWNRAGHQPKDVLCPWWQYAWNQGPELVALMLDRWDYTGDTFWVSVGRTSWMPDEAFLTEKVLPMAESVLKYFDTRFKKDSHGRIVLDPTQSVETYWHGVVNDMPTVAGLNNITARLCALPADLVTKEQQTFFAKMRAACPTVPVEEAEVRGKRIRRLAPAQKYSKNRSNCENPELYAIWPFRLYGVGRPGLEEARAAYAARHNHLDRGWGYDGNCAALLGGAIQFCGSGC
jgi:alpha-L-fucosidase 2